MTSTWHVNWAELIWHITWIHTTWHHLNSLYLIWHDFTWPALTSPALTWLNLTSSYLTDLISPDHILLHFIWPHPTSPDLTSTHKSYNLMWPDLNLHALTPLHDHIWTHPTSSLYMTWPHLTVSPQLTWPTLYDLTCPHLILCNMTTKSDLTTHHLTSNWPVISWPHLNRPDLMTLPDNLNSHLRRPHLTLLPAPYPTWPEN